MKGTKTFYPNRKFEVRRRRDTLREYRVNDVDLTKLNNIRVIGRFRPQNVKEKRKAVSSGKQQRMMLFCMFPF
jgi:hypothetical protein